MDSEGELPKFSIPGQLQRFCVFCGKEPSGKTCEHVIPKWLLRLTGDEKRNIRVGLNKTSGEIVSHSATAYVFPSCDECNNSYATLEALAQRTIEGLLNNLPVSEAEMSSLLDWFDKVRIGLWLGDMMRNPSQVIVRRKFHISQRIGQSDRCLCIGRTDSDWTGFAFAGIVQPLFHLMPSCFGLIVNNLYFLSLSSGLWFGHRLGLPTLADRVVNETTGHLHGHLVRGKGRVRLPLTKLRMPEGFKSFYQPCYESSLLFDSQFSEYISCKFSQSRMLPGSAKGRIFNENGETTFSGDMKIAVCDDIIPLRKKYINYLFVKSILQSQIELIKISPPNYHWSKDYRLFTKKLYKAAIRANRQMLKALEDEADEE